MLRKLLISCFLLPEENQRKKIKKSHSILVRELDCQNMRIELFCKEILHENEVDSILQKINDVSQCEQLLIILHRKEPSRWVRGFLDILKKSDEKLYNAVVSNAEDETIPKEAV